MQSASGSMERARGAESADGGGRAKTSGMDVVWVVTESVSISTSWGTAVASSAAKAEVSSGKASIWQKPECSQSLTEKGKPV